MMLQILLTLAGAVALGGGDGAREALLKQSALLEEMATELKCSSHAKSQADAIECADCTEGASACPVDPPKITHQRVKADCKACDRSLRCADCDGRGTLRCMMCKGIGSMWMKGKKKPIRMDCPDCTGGRKACGACDRTGRCMTCHVRVDWESHRNCASCDGRKTVECGNCHGAGKTGDCGECRSIEAVQAKLMKAAAELKSKARVLARGEEY